MPSCRGVGCEPCRVTRYASENRMRARRGMKRGSDGSSVFFFQAEDGIRDLTVTGVQTCALPISETCPGAIIIGFHGSATNSSGTASGATSLSISRPSGTLANDVMLASISAHGSSDRKSTRLNSSHSQISYAVFCLKNNITTHIVQ